MIKRLLSVLLSVALPLFLLPTSAYAASDMIISADSITAECKSGTEISIPVSAEQNNGFAAGTVDIVWDKSVLELKSVTFTENAPDNGSGALTQGRYRVSFGNYLLSENYDKTGELFTLSFEITDTATAGDHLVALENAVVYDTDLNAVSVSLNSANVSLSGETSENDLLLEVGTVGLYVNNSVEIRVPVEVKQNPGFVAGTADLKWDSEALTLERIEYTELAPDNGSAEIVSNGSYRISFGSFLAEDDQKNTGEVFTLVFKANEDTKPGDYPILLGNATVVDTGHKYVPISVINGRILLEEETTTTSTTTTATSTTATTTSTSSTSKAATTATSSTTASTTKATTTSTTTTKASTTTTSSST